MRLAIVSDIHGNRTAFEAVLADLNETSPDLIFHGGDLADAGSSPVEIVDRIRDMGWPGVAGNTDEMLFDPQSLIAFASQSPAMQPLLPVIEEMAAATRAALGEERIAWLSRLPRRQVHGEVALVHASPESCWRSPWQTSSDAELESAYSALDHPVIIYGHIHHSYIRATGGMTIVNSGSVSLSYDGDRRASYVLIDDGVPRIRRVEYAVDRELKALADAAGPHWQWVARILETASPQMP